MRKERWKHFKKEKCYVRGDTALCGKVYVGWKNTVFVSHKKETTCPRCIAKLKEFAT